MNETDIIKEENGTIRLLAGIMEREISLQHGNVSTLSLLISGNQIVDPASGECCVCISFCSPNERPRGILPENAGVIEQSVSETGGSDTLMVKGVTAENEPDDIWHNTVHIQSKQWNSQFSSVHTAVQELPNGVSRLILQTGTSLIPELENIAISISYEVYRDFPVIRKWIEIENGSGNWIKLTSLMIDDINIVPEFLHLTELTPSERGALSSMIAFGSATGDSGIILASEIPSVPRYMGDQGGMGYNDTYFEWVLGPGRTFVSEPVFHYAYAGEITQTLSGHSYPLDRTVEYAFKHFLKTHIGVLGDTANLAAPLWCTWSSFGPQINDTMIRQQAKLAESAGFAMVLLDAGWQTDGFGMEADTAKFPDLAATCSYMESLGLRTGLWVSCFRGANSPDLAELPHARSLPLIKRGSWNTIQEAYALSFTSPWRDYYANSMVGKYHEYGVSYFKQDLTNVQYGDIAEGHDSHTLKESYLRGLRGLLAAQDKVRHSAPAVTIELTHEIYWGTPGVPCDLAVLKHVHLYHIPPNDYSGVGHWMQSYSSNTDITPEEVKQELITGCYNVRKGMYAHRGLPLYCLEYYAAASFSVRGSLTGQIQDRQICSWLMGAPLLFAGDLSSLSDEQIRHYRRRFDLVKRLQQDYDIYAHFQFSGVPAPTDTDWHWWGKLNQQGSGAVVIIRGSEGDSNKQIHIPWIANAIQLYKVTALFAEQELGEYTGKQLEDGFVELQLPQYSQEILEIELCEM